MSWNPRVERIAPFRVMSLLETAQAREAAGHDVIHLEVGEPDFPTPAPVVEAGRAALSAGHTRYTPAAGLPALREAIAGHYAEHFGAAVDPRRILVTPGASGALLLASQLLAGPGDRVLMADPNYPCNRHFMALAGAEVDAVPVGPASGWQLDAGLVETHWRDATRLAMLATPSNPTGHMLDAGQLSAVAETVAARGGHLLVDEIYQGLCFDLEPLSVASLSADAFVVNSFSKYFGMTGWRLGWLVAPQAWVPAIERLAQNWFLAPATVAQHAAMAAFGEESLAIAEQRRQLLDRRRTLLMEALPGMGLPVVGGAEGAFYLYLDVSAYTDDSFVFCRDLLERTGVALTPGLDFGGHHHPERYLRLAYTCEESRLHEALERLRAYLERP